MRVAPHEFATNRFDDIGNVELAFFIGQLGKKHDLQQKVTKLGGERF